TGVTPRGAKHHVRNAHEARKAARRSDMSVPPRDGPYLPGVDGQLVIAKDIRENLHLQPGDRLDCIIRDNGDVVLRPVLTEVRELKGLLHQTGRQPVSLMTM